MIDVGIVYGSIEQAKPIIINSGNVYIHTDIEKLNEDVEGNHVDNLYRYHEVQYTQDEYILLLSELLSELKSEIECIKSECKLYS